MAGWMAGKVVGSMAECRIDKMVGATVGSMDGWLAGCMVYIDKVIGLMAEWWIDKMVGLMAER